MCIFFFFFLSFSRRCLSYVLWLFRSSALHTVVVLDTSTPTLSLYSPLSLTLSFSRPPRKVLFNIHYFYCVQLKLRIEEHPSLQACFPQRSSQLFHTINLPFQAVVASKENTQCVLCASELLLCRKEPVFINRITFHGLAAGVTFNP